ncbi:hypothetical protein E6C27_scaffold102G001020 [Cucumis melo var. makuwa]|uniref:Uncharacterized protein n=1 Tax=Cucumis melo var. makuwa TaxID=1194695 RepID=A0A5A7UIA6_CUCMM|nr:hypothetical protein E6C27_scaffold102G001020 [Cucumis melo var. makuwa]
MKLASPPPQPAFFFVPAPLHATSNLFSSFVTRADPSHLLFLVEPHLFLPCSPSFESLGVLPLFPRCVSARISRISDKLDLESVLPFTWIDVEDVTAICNLDQSLGCAVNGVVISECSRSTRLICVSFGSTRLIHESNGITRLICGFDGATRLICVLHGITRLLCCRVRASYEADRRGARRIREGHMGMSSFIASDYVLKLLKLI